MTREEAINFGEMWLDMNEDAKDSLTYKFFERAIAALKAEPCEDCVSREDVLKCLSISTFKKMAKLSPEGYIAEYRRRIKSLPSVTPKQRTGKWILVRNKLGATIDRICSCCNRSHEKTSDFCPNCGAKMEGDR